MPTKSSVRQYSSIMNHVKVDFIVMATSTILLSLAFLRVIHGVPLDNTTIQIPDEQRLRDALSRVRSWTVRPVENYTDRLDINLRFLLNRVAELDLKDQVLTLNVNIEQEWVDYKYKWDPNEYGDITQINVPSESIWLPDFQLYNAFGEFKMKSNNVLVHHTGKILWKPFAVLQTFCPIEVTYYPFDIQKCTLVFGSWTYDGDKLFMTLMDLKRVENGSTLPVGMVLKDYYPSSEWDLLSIPAVFKINIFPCCPEPYTSVEFYMTLRRHSQFYLINLVMPLMGLSYLSLLVFYLPADSGEKITLSVSLVTSQVLFLMLMMDNVPVTSLAVPLLGKIIIFNMILVFISIICTTIVLNIYYRKPTTHSQPKWVRRVRYSLLPKLLLMEAIPLDGKSYRKSCCGQEREGSNYGAQMDSESRLKEVSRLCSLSLQEINCQLQGPSQDDGKYDIQRAYNSVCYVRNYMQRLEETNAECEEWKFLSAVLDRIFLILFNVAFFVGTAVLMIDAPALYDHRKAVDKTLSTISTQQEDLELKENYDVSANDSWVDMGNGPEDSNVVFDE